MRNPIGRCVERSITLAVLILLGFSSGFLATPPAHSHGRSVSYSTWEIDPAGAEVSLRLRLVELSRRGPEALSRAPISGAHPRLEASGRSASVFPQELVLWADGEPCSPPATATRRHDQPGWVRYQWRIECPPGSSQLEIRSRVLLDVAPSHLHFARIRGGSHASTPVRERVLTESDPTWVLRRATDTSASTTQIGSDFRTYVKLGVEHILTGWDHLAFVFGLVLLAGRFGEIARLVTGFTLAHSLTLALAVLDRVHPDAAAVEMVIGFSVALVATEKAWFLAGRPRSVPVATVAGLSLIALASFVGWSAMPVWTALGLILFVACYFELLGKNEHAWLRISLTFAFGLVHGFGFAGVLVEMSLPSERLVHALLGFNLGVELGQLGVVLALWPILALGRRLVAPSIQTWALEVSTASLCGVGLYWFAVRALSM